MKTKMLLPAVLIFSFIFHVAASQSVAQNFPTYHPLGPAKGTLYRPTSGPANIAIIMMHRTGNFLSLGSCSQMRDRGFVVLCMNTRFDNNEAQVIFEEMALDVRAGINFLRQNQSGLTPGIQRVILWGYSGGGPTMSFYQAVAEAGVGFCQDPHKLTQCESSGSTNLVGLPKADGIILADAHPGNTVNALRAINPAVREGEDNEVVGVDAENGPIHPLKRLDPFDPDNFVT